MDTRVSLRVQLHSNPKHPEGFSVTFPWSQYGVDIIKKVLGLSWNKEAKTWDSIGPEILLDLQRFGVEVEWMSGSARKTAEAFRQQLWDSLDCRSLPVDDDEYGYQPQGSQFLNIMGPSILGDDMGTGKSKQSLDASKLRGAKNILVLCPKTLTYNWLNEVAKWDLGFTAEVLPDLIRSQSPKNSSRWKPNRKDFWTERPNVTITNYEKVLASDWPFDTKWDILICDEATRLKNSSTATYKAVKRIRNRAGVTWPLTGTPLEIRVMELYNILGLIRPAVLGSYMRFVEQHCKTDWVGEIVGVKNIDLLRDRIAPFILRRTKDEVLRFLPKKLPPQLQFVKLSVAETAAYQAFTSEFNNWLDEHGVSGGGNPLVEMLRMRQFCCTPDLFTKDLGRGSKYEALEEIISEWPDKIVIFCSLREVVERLHSWLGCHSEAIISGNVSHTERIPRINAFNSGQLGKVLVSTDAGQQGLNITGANLCIHYDQIFNPMKMRQREDRLHRIGQTDQVTVMHMLCIDTIDFGMYELNREREDLFKELIDGAEEALLRKLDAPRLRRLVEGRL